MIVKIEGMADKIQVERNRRWRERVPGLFPSEDAGEESRYSTKPIFRNVARFWYDHQASATPPDLSEPPED